MFFALLLVCIQAYGFSELTKVWQYGNGLDCTQFGGVPVVPDGQVGLIVDTQFGGVPVLPDGQVGLIVDTQFGGVPVLPDGQVICVGWLELGRPIDVRFPQG